MQQRNENKDLSVTYMYLDIIWTNRGPIDLGGPERSHTLHTLRAGPAPLIRKLSVRLSGLRRQRHSEPGRSVVLSDFHFHNRKQHGTVPGHRLVARSSTTQTAKGSGSAVD
jgi:hypothetical protein